MIRWHDFHKKRPKKGWYLVHMEIDYDQEADFPDLTLADLVCVAHYDPTAGSQFCWHSPLFDNIAVTHWAKINLPMALDEPK